MVDILGPLLVGGFGGVMGGFSMLGSIMSKLPNVASTFSNMLNPHQISPQQLMLMRAIGQQQQPPGGGP